MNSILLYDKYCVRELYKKNKKIFIKLQIVADSDFFLLSYHVMYREPIDWVHCHK